MAKVIRANQELLVAGDMWQHEKAIDDGSITPRTHQYRNVYKDIVDLKQAGSVPVDMRDSIFYVDTYSHKTWQSEVLHFGINSYHLPIRHELELHNKQQAVEIAKLGRMSNASSAKEYPRFVKQINITDCEQSLIQHAIEHLITNNLKVVLVDTFPRALKPDVKKQLNLGDIEITQSLQEPLATHTVILYHSTTTNQILVLDPNNPKFSGHLQRIDISQIQQCQNIVVSNNPSELHKIYSPESALKVGPNGHQYRDCIDIGVKIAALLRSDPTDYTDHNQIIMSKAVWLVSNNADITKIKIDKPLRIKQVSNLTKMEEINDKLVLQNQDFKKKVANLEADEEAKEAPLKQQIEALQQALQLDIQQSQIQYDADVDYLMGQIAADPDLAGGNYA